jgi:hypothetical protein
MFVTRSLLFVPVPDRLNVHLNCSIDSHRLKEERTLRYLDGRWEFESWRDRRQEQSSLQYI